MPQGVDGVTLASESNVRVNAGGDTDVGVAEYFLDHDEVDALFQERDRSRAAGVVETDAPESYPVEEAAEPGREAGWWAW